MAFSIQRAEILMLIEKHQGVNGINVTELAKKINISGGTTIYRHLEELKQRKLITMTKQTKKRGSPIIVKTTPEAKPFAEDFFKIAKTFGIK